MSYGSTYKNSKPQTGLATVQRQPAGATTGLRLIDNRAYTINNRAYHSAQLKTADPVAQLQLQNVQPEAAAVAGTVQREKKKQAVTTVTGAAALGLAGAYIGSALLPGLGTLGGALVGGLAGLVVGGVGGYVASKPKLYVNQQKKGYKKELQALREYQEENQHADNDYQKGTVVKYSRSNDRKFVGLLQHGGVLYTYDANSQLSIGSGQGVMKHAIVAGNKDVKAAGWARPQYSRAQENERIYRESLSKAEQFQKAADELERPAKKILKKYNVDYHGMQTVGSEKERETVQNYQNVTGLLEHHMAQAEKLEHMQKDSSGITKASRIELDNDSGHYAPSPSVKAEAFEGWRGAGFTNLVWKNKKL